MTPSPTTESTVAMSSKDPSLAGWRFSCQLGDCIAGARVAAYILGDEHLVRVEVARSNPPRQVRGYKVMRFQNSSAMLGWVDEVRAGAPRNSMAAAYRFLAALVR